MLKIIKCGSSFDIPRSNVVRVDTTYDGILVTLRDGTEIRFSMSVSPQIKAMMPIVQNSKARIVKLNLDAAMMGKYSEVITLITTAEPEVAPTIIKIPSSAIEKPKEKTENDNTSTTTTDKDNIIQKKKGGRPKGSKNTKTKSK